MAFGKPDEGPGLLKLPGSSIPSNRKLHCNLCLKLSDSNGIA
jgi:hypothetical protein